MAVVLSSSRCFNAVSNALEAVKDGDAKRAAVILRSIKSDARLMDEELKKYSEKLKKVERKFEEKAEWLTKERNQLYQQEQALRKKERELNSRKSSLMSQNEVHASSRNDAERRYRQAREEERKAREEYEKSLMTLLLPVLGIAIFLIKEAIEDNESKARQANRDMERYQRKINEANNDIRYTNARITNIQADIIEVCNRAKKLKKERDSCHEKLGTVNTIIAFVLNASKISSEIITLTESASLKTENLEKIMRFAAKKNTLKILQSGGTKTKVGSFKECWEEITDKMSSDILLYLDDEQYLE